MANPPSVAKFEHRLYSEYKQNQIMKDAIDQNVHTKEIDNLEEYLLNFQDEWKVSQSKRSARWRKHFIISFIISIAISILAPEFFWISIIVITYFAGSLFTLLRQNAKTTNQISEHKKQLKLVRLLRNFESSPFSEK